MESLLKFIKCSKCFELLEKPAVLPCGNFICEKHQHEDRDDNNSVYCSVCDLHHVIPNGGLIRILALENLIGQNIDCIDLGDEYRSAYDKLEDFSDLFERFEKLKNDPDDKIYSKINELKSEIDLRREELKNKIDEDALSIIKKLDDYEKECKTNIASIKAEIENNENLNEWGKDLDLWRLQMRTFKKDIDMWKKIHEESSSKYGEMETAYYKFYKDLFLNRLNDYNDLKLFVGNDSDMIK
jgi:DNA repair exonuclease SbcCD ATPase subunit